MYAALDALASVLIYECLQTRIGSDLEMQLQHGLQDSDAGQGAQEGRGTQMPPESKHGQQPIQHQPGVQTSQGRGAAWPDSACLEDRTGAGHEVLDCTPLMNDFIIINSSRQSAAQQEAIITEGGVSCQKQSGSSSPAEPLRSAQCCSTHAASSGPLFSAGMVHTRLQHAQQSPQLSRRAFIQLPEKRRPAYSPPLLRSQQETSGRLKCLHPSFITSPHII